MSVHKLFSTTTHDSWTESRRPNVYLTTANVFRQRKVLPNFGLTLDVGHLQCMGETPIAAHIERWKDRLWNVHIEDMRRGIHDHLMFGEGEMDFPPIFEALGEICYEGGVHVELSRHSHDAVNTARRALAFLELPWAPEVLNYRERLKTKAVASPTYEAVSKPLYTSAIGRWKNYQKYIEPCLEVLQPFIKEFGYES